MNRFSQYLETIRSINGIGEDRGKHPVAGSQWNAVYDLG